MFRLQLSATYAVRAVERMKGGRIELTLRPANREAMILDLSRITMSAEEFKVWAGTDDPGDGLRRIVEVTVQ